MPKDMDLYDSALRDTIVSRMRAKMRERRLSAVELAEVSGLNYTGVHDIYQGKSRFPRIDTLAAIARALGVSVAWLIGEVDHA